MERLCICLALALVAGGCATSASTRRGGSTGKPGASGIAGETTAATPPPCSTRVRLLAPAARKPADPTLLRGAASWQMLWSEALGDRSAIRFLAIGDDGKPRSPSAEIVDRNHVEGVSLTADGDGYLVGWSEQDKVFARKIDARGRPRSDAQAGEARDKATPAISVCADAPAGLRCTTPRGAIALPAGAKVAVEHIADDGAAVIAADAVGLSLYVLDCAAPPSSPVAPASSPVPAGAAATP